MREGERREGGKEEGRKGGREGGRRKEEGEEGRGETERLQVDHTITHVMCYIHIIMAQINQ